MDSNTDTSASAKRRRGRPPKYKTDEERIAGIRETKLKYYRAHKQENVVFHRQYARTRRLYMKLLELINLELIPYTVVQTLIDNDVIPSDYIKYIESPIFKDKNNVNELDSNIANGQPKPNSNSGTDKSANTECSTN